MVSRVNQSAAANISAVQHNYLNDLENVFEFAERQHEGELRHRPNKDGTPREYLCHTLEVAFIAAHYETVLRRKSEEGFPDQFVVKQLVKVVGDTAQLSKEQLKHKLRRVVKRLDESQMCKVVGLICHDVIERAYKRNLQPKQVLTPAEKDAIAKPLLEEIAKLFPGADSIVYLMTDPSNITSKREKANAQQSRAQYNPVYAELKSIDGLANTHDQASIPVGARCKEDMQRKLTDMHTVVHVACLLRPQLRHIRMAYDVIHARAQARLNAA